MLLISRYECPLSHTCLHKLQPFYESSSQKFAFKDPSPHALSKPRASPSFPHPTNPPLILFPLTILLPNYYQTTLYNEKHLKMLNQSNHGSFSSPENRMILPQASRSSSWNMPQHYPTLHLHLQILAISRARSFTHNSQNTPPFISLADLPSSFTSTTHPCF